MSDITYVTATDEHIEGFLALQDVNHVTNLTEVQQNKNGYVTLGFTAEKLRDLMDREHLFVALYNNEVVAYLVCASWQYLSDWPIIAHMVNELPKQQLAGQVTTTENSYQYGPICIREDMRGKGVLMGIYQFARSVMAEHYPLGVTFINRRNGRSMKAHTEKLGLELLGAFAFNKQNYQILGFLTADD